ncbi:MAG: type VI secretion system baseplate subunit TssE [Betaproteobacteria bacterium]
MQVPNIKSGDDGPTGDRLQPAMLDRLTDDDPTHAVEATDAVSMTRTRLRRAVLRDIAWILNATNMESDTEFAAFPEARRSVVNFGVQALSGRRVQDIDWQALELAIKDAIIAFEPRVLADTLDVRVATTENSIDHHNMLSFEIRGQLWSLPYPMELLLRSHVDLESGQVILMEQTANLKT